MKQASPNRQPIFNVPGVILAFIALIAGIHFALVQVFSANFRSLMIIDYGFIPLRITDYLANGGAIFPAVVTSVSYSFLHGDWLHLLVNSIWMLAFGSIVARRIGVLRFVAFCVVSSIMGALAHYLFNIGEIIPMIGASAVVSGCMGAAMRFAFPPGGGFSARTHDLPFQPLTQCLQNPSIIAFIAVWFFVNLAFGLGGELVTGGGAIEWQAHLGGFLFGLLAFRPFDPRR